MDIIKKMPSHVNNQPIKQPYEEMGYYNLKILNIVNILKHLQTIIKFMVFVFIITGSKIKK